MSTLLAEDVPLPQSRQSPFEVDGSLKEQTERKAGEGEEGKEQTEHSPKILDETDSAEVTSSSVRRTDAIASTESSGSGVIISNEGQSERNAPENSNHQVENANVAAETAQGSESDEEDAEGSTIPTQTTNTSAIARVPTPSSRTSTPPLAPGSIPRKFVPVNVNKKFLNKTITPASGSPVGSTKLGNLSSTSPIPSSTTSSRLLSTKLTTVPSSKATTSPQPPTSSATTAPSASPWAKPPAPTPDIAAGPGPNGQIHQPAPTRARLLTTTPTVMGVGIGIGASVPKPAWKNVPSEAKRAQMGLSRDFPTAKEVAEGKREAQAVAQAKAAQNQAILQGLNAFTQLDPNAHRWEDEDDDDEVIDFGDGTVYPHHEHHAQREAILDQPVSKSERFAEDFDRSWPRQRSVVSDQGLAGPPRRPENSDRVLFNASSNRLEASRQQQQQQPSRLLPRPDATRADRTPIHSIPSASERSLSSLPPNGSIEHNTNQEPLPSREQRIPSQTNAAPPRQAWSAFKETDRTSHSADRQPLPPQSAAFDTRSGQSNQRQSFSQAARTPVAPAQSEQVLPTASQDPATIIDAQAAEMHTAAEKARLRRLAEEQDREAAAERARQKAKELEERFGKKEGKSAEQSSVQAESTSKPTPHGLSSGPIKSVPQPGFTLAQRERGTLADTGKLALPTRPTAEVRNAEGSWRRASAGMSPGAHSDIAHVTPQDSGVKDANVQHRTIHEQDRSLPAPPQAGAPATTPPVPHGEFATVPSPERGGKRDQTFDSMLARIQAAMDEARAPPPQLEIDSAPAERNSDEHTAKRPIPTAIKTRPPVTEYFNLSRLDVPRSPPPAWRTYTVKLPRVSAKRPSVPAMRLKAFQARVLAPTGWAMSFSPPIEGLENSSLSRSDLLLLQTVGRRFGRPVDSGPIVSISPRKLRPFERKKKKVYDAPRFNQIESVQTIESAAALLGDATSVSGSAFKLPGDDSTQRPATNDRWSKLDIPPKAKSPVKSAAQAEREGLFDGVGIGIPERARALSDAKPGVRFMVSSELEGDSLLDEVNKISLETVGEGYDEKGPEETRPRAIPSGSDTPKTPPSLGTNSRAGTSPNGSSTPWTNASSSTQHDHLKSMWSQAPAHTSEHASRSEPPSISKSGASQIAHPQQQYGSVNQTAESATPMYPSLNAPSSADPPAPQPLPLTTSGAKMAYSQSHTSQPFSPTSQGFSSQSPGPYTYSPDAHSQTQQTHQANSSLSNLNLYRNGAGMNGYQHQNVWSPSAFGTGYGYTKTPSHAQAIPSLEQKAASAALFSATPGKELYGNGNDYRAFHAAQAQNQAHHGQSPQAHNFTAAAAAAAAYNRTTPTTGYGYYGTPGVSRGGRFGNTAQTSGDYYGAGAMESGYYGGLGGGYAYGQSGMGQGHGQPNQGVSGQHHQQSGRGMASQRKMWGM